MGPLRIPDAPCIIYLPTCTIEINHSCRQIYDHTLSLWAWHFKNNDLWEIPKIWKKNTTSCQEDVHCLVWHYNSKLQPHQYHQWSSPWSSWFKSYPIYVHRTPALLFWRLKGLGFLSLWFSPCFMRSFWITACRRKKNQLSLIWVMYFRTSLGLGSSIKLLMKRNLAHQWILEDDTLFYFS